MENMQTQTAQSTERTINTALAENLGAYATSMNREATEKEKVAQINGQPFLLYEYTKTEFCSIIYRENIFN